MAGHLEEATRVHESLKGVTLATLEGTYVLGEIFYRRGDRYIVRAQRLAAPGCLDTPHVVVKLSLRTALPSPEERLLHKARKVAIDAGGDTHWVLQRLPNIIHNEDLQITPGSTQARVAQIIDDMFCHCESCEERVACEERPGTMRIVIMEELFPIKTLTTASDLAQVFFDVLNCHKWLYDHPRILHRDISMNNIMYRFDEQRNVCGVLNDMDLSSDLEDPEDLKTTFLRRTGTPPFMAIDLLRKHSVQPNHLYRHDLESLFYVMLILFARYELIAAEPNEDRVERLLKRSEAPLSEWFDSFLSWETLADKKHIFFTVTRGSSDSLHMNNIMSSSFQGFRTWISRLKDALEDGLVARNRALREVEDSGEAHPSFVYETLGGEYQYSTFFEVMKSFEGTLLRVPATYGDGDTAMKL